MFKIQGNMVLNYFSGSLLVHNKISTTPYGAATARRQIFEFH